MEGDEIAVVYYFFLFGLVSSHFLSIFYVRNPVNDTKDYEIHF